MSLGADIASILSFFGNIILLLQRSIPLLPRVRGDALEATTICNVTMRLAKKLETQDSPPSERDIRVALGRMCESLARLLRVGWACIYTQDPEDPNWLSIWAAHGRGGEHIFDDDRFELVEHQDAPPPIGCVVRTWVTARAAVYRVNHPDFINKHVGRPSPPYKESLHVPLATGSRIFAVICVDAPRRRYFDANKDELLVRNVMQEAVLSAMRIDPHRSILLGENFSNQRR